MNDFETRLKCVPLAKPSRELKSRIFGAQAITPAIVRLLRFRVPLGWAAGFALMAGLAGLVASQLWSKGPPESLRPVTHIQIIRASTDRNMFDFTEPTAEFIPGELTVQVETPEAI
jgi:hypothetical protein